MSAGASVATVLQFFGLSGQSVVGKVVSALAPLTASAQSAATALAGVTTVAGTISAGGGIIGGVGMAGLAGLGIYGGSRGVAALFDDFNETLEGLNSGETLTRVEGQTRALEAERAAGRSGDDLRALMSQQGQLIGESLGAFQTLTQEFTKGFVFEGPLQAQSLGQGVALQDLADRLIKIGEASDGEVGARFLRSFENFGPELRLGADLLRKTLLEAELDKARLEGRPVDEIETLLADQLKVIAQSQDEAANPRARLPLEDIKAIIAEARTGNETLRGLLAQITALDAQAALERAREVDGSGAAVQAAAQAPLSDPLTQALTAVTEAQRAYSAALTAGVESLQAAGQGLADFFAGLESGVAGLPSVTPGVGSVSFPGTAAGSDPVTDRQPFATGGLVRGPGGPRSDAVPAFLSNGEFVINAGATRRHLPLLEAINQGRPLCLPVEVSLMPQPLGAGGGAGGFGVGDFLPDLDGELGGLGHDLESVFRGAFDQASQGLRQFVRTGKVDLEGLATGFLDRLGSRALDSLLGRLEGFLFGNLFGRGGPPDFGGGGLGDVFGGGGQGSRDLIILMQQQSRNLDLFGTSVLGGVDAIRRQDQAFGELIGRSGTLASFFAQLAGGGGGGGSPLGLVFGLVSAGLGLVGSAGGGNPFPIPTTGPDGLPESFARGGLVRGPGSGSSDSIRAMLSNGEFVVNAAATADNLPLLESLNAGRQIELPRAFLMEMENRAGGAGRTDQLLEQQGALMAQQLEVNRRLERRVRQQSRRTGTRPTEEGLGMGYTETQIARRQAAVAERARRRN